MNHLIDIIEKIFYTNLIGSVNLYMMLSTVFKFAFVLIVLYFIQTIARLIYRDITTMKPEPSPEPVIFTDNKIHEYALAIVDPEQQEEFDLQPRYFLYSGFKVGRASNRDLCIESAYISEDHATFIFQEGQVYLRDEQTPNGTKVNGQKITETTLLKPGDRITFVFLETVFIQGAKHV